MRAFLPKILAVLAAIALVILATPHIFAETVRTDDPDNRINAGETIKLFLEDLPLPERGASITYELGIFSTDGNEEQWESLKIDLVNTRTTSSGCANPDGGEIRNSPGARFTEGHEFLGNYYWGDSDPRKAAGGYAPGRPSTSFCSYEILFETPDHYQCNRQPSTSPVCRVKLLANGETVDEFDVEILSEGSSEGNPIDFFLEDPGPYHLNQTPPEKVAMRLEDLPYENNSSYKLILAGPGGNAFSTLTLTMSPAPGGGPGCAWAADELEDAWVTKECEQYPEGEDGTMYIKAILELAVDKLDYNTSIPAFTYYVSPYKEDSLIAARKSFTVFAQKNASFGEIDIAIEPGRPTEDQAATLEAFGCPAGEGGVHFTIWPNKAATEGNIEAINACSDDDPDTACPPLTGFESDTPPGDNNPIVYRFPQTDKSVTSYLIRAVCVTPSSDGKYLQGFRDVLVDGDGEYIRNLQPLQEFDAENGNEQPIDDTTNLAIPVIDKAGNAITLEVGGLRDECYYITIHQVNGPILNPNRNFTGEAGNPYAADYLECNKNGNDRNYGGARYSTFYDDAIDQFPYAFVAIDGLDGTKEVSIPMLPDGYYEIRLIAVGKSGFPAWDRDDFLADSLKFLVGTGKLPSPPLPPCKTMLVKDRDGNLHSLSGNELNRFEDYKALADAGYELIECQEVVTALGSLLTDPQQFVRSLLALLLSLSGGIALLLIIRSGYTLISSRGDPEKIGHAKEILTSAIIGLLFIIFSLVILEVIGVDILRLPGFEGTTPVADRSYDAIENIRANRPEIRTPSPAPRP